MNPKNYKLSKKHKKYLSFYGDGLISLSKCNCYRHIPDYIANIETSIAGLKIISEELKKERGSLYLKNGKILHQPTSVC